MATNTHCRVVFVFVAPLTRLIARQVMPTMMKKKKKNNKTFKFKQTRERNNEDVGARYDMCFYKLSDKCGVIKAYLADVPPCWGWVGIKTHAHTVSF